MKEVTTEFPVEQTRNEPMDAPAWMNLCFAKDGRSFPGIKRYPTKDAAKKAADRANFYETHNAQTRKIIRNTINPSGPDGTPVARQYDPKTDWYGAEHSHTIQIPARTT